MNSCKNIKDVTTTQKMLAKIWAHIGLKNVETFVPDDLVQH